MIESSALIVIASAAIATYASRAVGAMVSGKITVDSPIIDWITCVTYALLAGLVVRMIWMPIGTLGNTDDWMRFSAAGVGLTVFLLTKHNVGLSVLAGSLTLIGLTSYFGV
ncbi:AzlD domain-containing protein [Magnetovibrio sp. PR-2]|uniref:AzlD domain-containing protein n=1 Tax=Magnetovibrio sp. PR-2 TaxID=3120356 RepID=UPI002FCDF56A